jgi:AcrR family transcriptional regulator
MGRRCRDAHYTEGRQPQPLEALFTMPSPAAPSALRRTRRSLKGERRRAEILDAAMRIFARDGYGSASIAAVAAEVGLTLPGVLHYFPSKTEMLLAVLQMRDARSAELLDQDTPSLEAVVRAPPPSWAVLLDQLRRVNRANADMPGVVRAFSLLNVESLIEQHPAQAWFERRTELLLMHIARVVRQAQAQGELPIGADPEQVAAELVAMMDGLQVLWLRRPRQLDLVRYFEDYLDRLDAGLRR